jgi:membrane fusion protein (multidrug efflux system)
LQTVRTVGNAWLVDSGVVPGEKIITEGLQQVKTDALVHAIPATNVKLRSAFTAN